MAAVTDSVAAPTGATVIAGLLPAMAPLPVSVAVMVWLPAVLRVAAAGKLWLPLSPAAKV
ncbi:MAG TPA: hypothetical protein VFA05_03555 [Gaiellaceae bacterium]|nr:hypothetical protein [Gaiellaceae bacterium]